MVHVIPSKTVKWQHAVNEPPHFKHCRLKSPETHFAVDEPACHHRRPTLWGREGVDKWKRKACTLCVRIIGLFPQCLNPRDTAAVNLLLN